MSLEQVVRPFESGRITPATRVVTQEIPAEDIVVAFGRGTSIIQVFNLALNETAIVEDIGEQQEVSRETSVKRVFNPNDDQQWVDVERIDKLKMRNKLDPTKEQVYEFNNPD